MKKTNKKAENVAEYISQYSEIIQQYLLNIRSIVLMAVPDAKESIAYSMPAYTYRGRPLLYFAAFKSHIGLYATPSAHEYFAEELSHYKQGKGSVQFPLNKPMPYDLIQKMVEYKKEWIVQSFNTNHQ